MSPDRARIVAPPPLIYLGMLGLGLLLEWFRPTELSNRPLALSAGVAFLVCGVVGLLAAVRTMSRAQTTINPYKSTTTVVSDGIFRFSRNPIYVSDTVLYVGLGLVLDTWWALIFTPIVIWIMNVGVIAHEEAYLERKFGNDYLEYKQEVRRWL